MAKKRKKALFSNLPSHDQQNKDILETNSQTAIEKSFPELQNFAKFELLTVFIIVVIIASLFAALWLTNTKKEWINDFSLKIGKVLIKSF